MTNLQSYTRLSFIPIPIALSVASIYFILSCVKRGDERSLIGGHSFDVSGMGINGSLVAKKQLKRKAMKLELVGHLVVDPGYGL